MQVFIQKQAKKVTDRKEPAFLITGTQLWLRNKLKSDKADLEEKKSRQWPRNTM